MRCTHRGAVTLLFLSKTVTKLEVIHVQFIKGKVEDAQVELVRERRKRKIDEISKGENAEHGKAAVAVASLPQRVSSQGPSKCVPRSLSLVDMLRLGKLIPNTTTSVEIFNFDKSAMARTGRQAWSFLSNPSHLEQVDFGRSLKQIT